MPAKLTFELRFPDRSSDFLIEKREYFEKDGVFTAGIIDHIAEKLKAYNDKGLSERLYNKQEEICALVRQFLHYS